MLVQIVRASVSGGWAFGGIVLQAGANATDTTFQPAKRRSENPRDLVEHFQADETTRLILTELPM